MEDRLNGKPNNGSQLMNANHDVSQGHGGQSRNERPYLRLLAMAALSFVSMYILMYAMVNTMGNVYPNLNQFYMAGLMTGPMVLIELILTSAMYPSKKWNALIVAASVAALAVFLMFIWQQAAISDKQFLKSKIPHHAGAILMCDGASLRDPEIQELCTTIITGQQVEIDQMKAKLAELDG
ncbi:MAG: DUF305 domain-containing protein [Chloroflexota bacterium]